MFWFWMIMIVLSAVIMVLAVLVNASAFGMTEQDHKPLSEYEQKLGLGTTVIKRDENEIDKKA